jgi:hypothetical protein
MSFRTKPVLRHPCFYPIALLGLSLVLGASSLVVLADSAMKGKSHAKSVFAQALISDGPSLKLSNSAAAVSDWLVGDWEAEVYDVQSDGSRTTKKGEWHFQWVLEGRAIQDVWIVPIREQRTAQSPATNNRYGTSLRIYDPKLDAWRISWFNPVTQDRTELIGRRIGNAVVQQGIIEDGSFIRWTFQDITPASFTWRGEVSTDGGKTWQLDAEFHAHRINSQP